MSKTYHSRACPVCNGNDYNAHLKKGDLCLVQCTACSMVYVNPVISNMATGAFYDQMGLDYLSKEKLQSDYSDTRFERELRVFRKYCSKGTVLDVGCSSGGFLYQLIKRYAGDYRVLGTDISLAPLDYAEKMGVPVVRGDFLKHRFDEQFDAVTFWAVMEHLMEPRLFLKKASDVLKPGGICVILVPNFESLAVKLLGPKYRYILHEHVNYFTAKTLKDFVANEFEFLGVSSTHFNPIVILKDFRHQVTEVSRQERFELLRRTSGYKRSRWLFPIKLAYKTFENILGNFFLADNLTIICRKRLKD